MHFEFCFDFTAWFQQQVPFTKLLSFRTSLRAHFVNPLWVPPAARHPPRWNNDNEKGFVKCMLKFEMKYLDGNLYAQNRCVFVSLKEVSIYSRNSMKELA